MVVGVCTITLRLPGNGSLKGKRSVVKSLTARMRRQFNVSVAEVAAQDSWQTAIIGVACVSSDNRYAHGLLERALRWIEESRPDLEIVDYEIELC